MAQTPLACFYDRLSDKYDFVMNLTGYTILNRLVFRKLPAKFTSPRILDLGCGTGTTSGLIRKKFHNPHVTALDNSEKMLTVYHKRFPNNTIVFGDFNENKVFYRFPEMEIISLAPGSFDMVISVGAVLEYGIPEYVFAFVYSVLKTDGMVVIISAKKNVFADIFGTICWKYKLPDTRHIMEVIRNIGFRHSSCSLAGICFPANLFKEIIIAYK